MRMQGDGRKAKNPKKTFMRLLSYLKPYTGRLVFMLACILFSTGISVVADGSISTLIDDYITPMLSQTTPDYIPVIRFLVMLAGLYILNINKVKFPVQLQNI